MDILSNDKRWLVTLVTSNKVVAPVLQHIVKQGMDKLYAFLDNYLNGLPTPCSLQTLTYADVCHLAATPSPAFLPKDLNFRNINNNYGVHGKTKMAYNYNVNSPVDLAKLYLPDYLAVFSAFDKSMDLSAALRLLGCRKYPIQIFVSTDPLHDIQLLADDVRQNVRNPGSHFKESDWTQIFFDQCFDKLQTLLQCLPLLPDKKKELSDQLSTWKTEGFKQIVDNDVKELQEKFLNIKLASINDKLDDIPTREENERVLEKLYFFHTSMMHFFHTSTMDRFDRMESLLQNFEHKLDNYASSRDSAALNQDGGKNVHSTGSSTLSTEATSKETHQMREKDLAPSVTRTSQVASVRGHPAKCDKTLKVTLLASEWNSSRGGLSTINRHLAILMAKRSEVQVTLLVPQFACSEEEKRAAESRKIVIKEAERRPGYDPLDWLSFPPEDLIIDVVVGHGAKLGKQAQIIRKYHSCQWVQVVHTAPEELGMFKNYPRAIARGEEKTTAEVDLCKLANLVVPVGPKLTEAYSAYLRSCEKQQDIMSFTPGTLKEFSTLNQASVDSEKFRVLTFGRGDPEDFGLKGYDIAAKAVVELKDNSYHLIFVGAPDDKQEAVTENLLQNGISKRQLTVRRFLQSKEKLKDCFCEVDLCIMPSRTEGFGLTALEALSAGLPILVSGNSGFGDALRSVPSGKSFVVDSEDPKVWAEAIAVVRKKKRPERLKEIERLRASYEEQFSWKKQCDLLVDKMWDKVDGAGLLERTIQNLQRMQLCASTVNNSTTLTEELTTIVSDKGLRISDNQGSGNCMFHALSEQLEIVKGIKIQHGQLRQSLVQYLMENPKLPDGTDLFHFVHGHETWADYLAYMEQDGAWGDHLILCTAANLFKTCIYVVSSLDNDVDIRPHDPVDESKPLVLGHIHEVHYVSLQPIQG